MMNLTYQKSTKEDMEGIFEQCKNLIDSYEDLASIPYENVLRWVRKKIEEKLEEYTTVYADGEKAGYYHFGRNEEGVMEIDDLYIFPHFQSQGIGSKILNECCEQTNEPVILYVFIRNERAVALYERLGFQVVETIGSSRYIMRRQKK